MRARDNTSLSDTQQPSARSSRSTTSRESAPAMFPFALVVLLASVLLPLAVRGSALTTAIGPNERLCFYADVDKAGEKIGVRPLLISYSLSFSANVSVLHVVLLCRPVRWLLRDRLRGLRPRLEGYSHWHGRAPGRFRAHRQHRRRVRLLLLERHVLSLRKVHRL